MKAKLLKQIRSDFNIYLKKNENLGSSTYYLYNKKTAKISKFGKLSFLIDNVATFNISYVLFGIDDRKMKIKLREHKVLASLQYKII